MTYTADISFNQQYIHAIVEGTNTARNVERYFTDIQRAVELYQCKHILIEERLAGHGLDIFEVFELIRVQARYARDNQLCIAYIDLNRDHHSNAVAFGENLANILGVNVKVFSATEDAKKWLSEK
ncbi:MAG: hypothetical protein WDA22_16715 [Bacteroidota bacterium]